MKKIFRKIIPILLTLIIGGLWFYLFLPPINIHSIGFWILVIMLLSTYTILSFIFEINNTIVVTTTKIKSSNKIINILPLVILGIVVLIFMANIVSSPLFNAKKYASRIKIDNTKSFTDEIPLVDFDRLPILDKDSSRKLGDRVMGQMPELVSQFDVSDLYTQINYNDRIIRVTPIEYNDFFKYLSNRKNGTRGYITVNSVTGESLLVKLEKGMKYLPSAFFSEDLYRHLRFNYPTKIFEKETFEIDNQGNPYWVVPTIKYTAVGLRKEISGAVILNPINGKSKYYDVKDIPKWVDHVYPADLIIEQVDNWGKYNDGFFNSIIGQKNVVNTTVGYNYTIMDDDVYMYTGITSVAKDEANLGFILTNLRTKETKYYLVPGAEEYSAMASVEGQVQQMKYKSTFPLLINLNNKPTYFVSLKDNAGLVKMYGFVDVVDYQKVVVTDVSEGIEQAARNYLGNKKIDIDKSKLTTETFKINYLNSVQIKGNTFYYLIGNNTKYKVEASINEEVTPFMKVGDTVKVSYQEKATVTDVISIEYDK